MISFLKRHSELLFLVLAWLLVAAFASPLTYALLPISVLLMRRSELWPDMLFGFILVLILSDMHAEFTAMAVMKNAKYTYIIILAVIFLMERARMQPQTRIFMLFLPFFVFAFFPIVRSPEPVVSFMKTVSYALLFLVIPNYVLLNFRRYGWPFFKDLVYFLVAVLASQHLFALLGPESWSYLAGRYRGYFGNPNGLAIFCFLTFVLFTVVSQMRKGLFTRTAILVIYGIIVYTLLITGSRASLMATLLFFLFARFFRMSPFLGSVAFLSFIGVSELLTSNLPAIITALGLQDYLRVDSLEDGSGRYFAWQFAWQKLNEGGFFLFGGGFENDEHIMGSNYQYLSRMGHQGGVHNTYLTFWLDVGIVGLLIYFRSFFLVFIKAAKRVPIALAVMFSVMFSILYESWLAASLNPYTILFLIILTLVSEDEIFAEEVDEEEAEEEEDPLDELPPPLVLPAR